MARAMPAVELIGEAARPGQYIQERAKENGAGRRKDRRRDGYLRAAARLVEYGGTILEDTRSDAGIVLLFLTDPDGTRVELMGAAG